MSGDGEKLPGFGAFLWMLFMQPVTLYLRLKACGIEDPDGSAWRLWRAPEPGQAVRRAYVRRVAILLLVPVFIFIVLGILPPKSQPPASDFMGIVIGITMYIVVGPGVSLLWGILLGSTCIAALLLSSMVFEVIRRVDPWYRMLGDEKSIVAALLLAAAAVVELDIRVTEGKVSKNSPVSWAMVGGLAGYAFYDSWIVSLVLGAAVLIVRLRIPVYPIEALTGALLYAVERYCGISTLKYTPVLYHDLGCLPYPFLSAHLALAVERDPVLVRRVVDACLPAYGAGRFLQLILFRLELHELKTCACARRFQEIVGLQDADSRLPIWRLGSFTNDWRSTARYFLAAGATMSPHRQIGHIKNAEQELATLERKFLDGGWVYRRELRETLDAWKAAARDLRREAEAKVAAQVPNPFQPAAPLTPEQGREIFRGREALVDQIESILASPTQRFSIALLGPRRSGKSSLLRMLPVLLPDAVCIFFDLLDHPVDSSAGFFRALCKAAQEQARRDHRLELPPLPEGSPFESASAWLRALDDLAGDRRILLCIDEFEHLEKSFPGDSSDLGKLMGLFRATIQHRRKVDLLVSGAAPFDELSNIWNEYFVNVQEVRLDLLDRQTSLELLTRPVEGFPVEAVPAEVAEAIFVRTGGQPFLLQAYGSALITRINKDDRDPRRACLDDIPAVEQTVLESWKYALTDLVNSKKMPPAAHAALLALAADKTPELDPRTRLWLCRRCLLTKDDRLRIPVIGAWIREEIDE